MPIYEYACEACDHRFELIQKVHDAVLKDCPECHEAALKKLVSAPSFSFKGSGWYKDLYGSANAGGVKGSSGSGTSSTSGESSSTSAAPAATAPAAAAAPAASASSEGSKSSGSSSTKPS